MGVEDYGVPCGYHIHNIASYGGNGMSNWCYAANDTPRSKFLHGNAGIAAHPVGIEKLRAEHISNAVQFGNLMIKTPYLCLLKFNLAQRSALSAHICLTISMILERAAQPFFWSCSNPPAAAVAALEASSKTPWRPGSLTTAGVATGPTVPC